MRGINPEIQLLHKLTGVSSPELIMLHLHFPGGAVEQQKEWSRVFTPAASLANEQPKTVVLFAVTTC